MSYPPQAPGARRTLTEIAGTALSGRDWSTDFAKLQTLPDQVPLQFVDGTLIVNERFFKKIYDGYGFSISHRFEDIAADATVEVYLENPSGSGRTVFIMAIECSSFAQGWIDVYRGASVTSAGTGLTAVNLNLGSTNASVVDAEYGGTYDVSGAELVHNTVLPGGARVRAVGELAEVGESVVTPEDYSLLVRITNKGATASDMSIRIMWWEEVEL